MVKCKNRHKYRRKWKDPSADMLCAALNGDNAAIEQLLSFYNCYINQLCMMEVRDHNDVLIRKYIDEDRKQIISIAFVKSVRNFAKVLLEEKTGED